MSATDEFNFIAPQFVQSLGEGDLDDGADNFFDAEENVAAGSTNSVNKETVGNEVDRDQNTVTEEKALTTVDDTAGSANENNEVLNCPDENMKPPSNLPRSNSRLSRMSVKKLTSPSRKSSRFISQAEQLHKFHHATPPRFKRKSGVFKSRMSKILPTIPHSPMLHTKARARQSTIQSMPDLTARPVVRPLRRMEAKPPPKPAPKPATVPQPFNLTDVNKFKKMPKADSTEITESMSKATATVVTGVAKKAKPQETGKLEVNEGGKKQKSPVAGSKTPNKPVNVKKKTLEVRGDNIVVTETWPITGLKISNRPNKSTKPVPFTFEARNQERLKAKQMKLEEAKEAKTDNLKAPSRVVRPSTAASTVKSEAKRNLPRPSLNKP